MPVVQFKGHAPEVAEQRAKAIGFFLHRSQRARLPDSRSEDATLGLLDVVTDNAASSGFAIGASHHPHDSTVVHLPRLLLAAATFTDGDGRRAAQGKLDRDGRRRHDLKVGPPETVRPVEMERLGVAGFHVWD